MFHRLPATHNPPSTAYPQSTIPARPASAFTQPGCRLPCAVPFLSLDGSQGRRPRDQSTRSAVRI